MVEKLVIVAMLLMIASSSLNLPCTQCPYSTTNMERTLNFGAFVRYFSPKRINLEGCYVVLHQWLWIPGVSPSGKRVWKILQALGIFSASWLH
jgi:hypothetical protein